MNMARFGPRGAEPPILQQDGVSHDLRDGDAVELGIDGLDTTRQRMVQA